MFTTHKGPVCPNCNSFVIPPGRCVNCEYEGPGVKTTPSTPAPMTWDARREAHELRLFKNRCGTLDEICRHDDAACNKVTAALEAAYRAGSQVVRAETLREAAQWFERDRSGHLGRVALAWVAAQLRNLATPTPETPSGGVPTKDSPRAGAEPHASATTEAHVGRGVLGAEGGRPNRRFDSSDGGDSPTGTGRLEDNPQLVERVGQALWDCEQKELRHMARAALRVVDAHLSSRQPPDAGLGKGGSEP